MTKSPQAFRTISEVADTLDIPAHVLRFWESRFPQLRPMKSSGGRRYYRPEDVSLLRGIRELLYVDGLTIKGVQKIFREQGQQAVVLRGYKAAELQIEEDADAVEEAAVVNGSSSSTRSATPRNDIVEAEQQVDKAAIGEAVARLESIRDRIRRSIGD